MANQRYTLTSYDPIYVVAEEVSAQALADALDRWQPSRVLPAAVAPYAVERIVGAYEAELLRHT